MRPARKRQNCIHLFLLTLILVLAGYLRLVNFPNRVSLGLDSARDAFVSLVGAKYLQLPITGPFISIAPVTTGPWYWIQLIVFRLLVPSNFAPWLLLALYSLGGVFVMYAIGRVLSGKRLGLLLSLLATFSPDAIDNATELTNPSVIAFFSELTILLFLLLLKKRSGRLLSILFGAVLGLTVNTHYQSLGLFILVFILLFIKSLRGYILKFTLPSFAFTFIPTLIFEFNNHWFNSRNIWQYLTVDQFNIWTPMRWLTYLSDFWPTFVAFIMGGSAIFGALVIAAISLVFIWQLFRRRLPLPYVLLGVSFLINVVIIRYYRGERYFGYLQFFHPYVFIFTGYVLTTLWRIRWGALIASLFFILYTGYIAPTIVERLKDVSFTAETYEYLAGIYQSFGQGPFTLYKCRDTVLPRINGLVLKLMMDGRYAQGGKTLLYHWGCQIPNVLVDGTVISHEFIHQHASEIYPRFDYVYDVSQASPAAMLLEGWREASPESMYQSAARWWMDEQPGAKGKGP